MAQTLSFEEAKEIVQKAMERYERAETKGEVQDIMLQYGQGGVGWKPLCRVLFAKMPIEKALKAYENQEESNG